MKHLLFVVVALLAVSCSRQAEGPPRLIEQAVAEIQGNAYWRSLALLDYARLLARKGQDEKSREIALDIPNYRRALGLLAVPEAKVAAGQFAAAREELLAMGDLPRYGAGPQQSEITSALVACAEAAGCADEVIAMLVAKNIPSARVYQSAAKSTSPSTTEGKGQTSDSQGKNGVASPQPPLGASAALATSGAKPGVKPGVKPSGEDKDTLLLRRMARAAGSQGLAFRLQGLLAAKREEEARQLLSAVLGGSETYPFANVGAEAEIRRLAWRAGWDSQPEVTLDRLKKMVLDQPGDLETGYAFLEPVVLFAVELKKPEMARELLAAAEAKAEGLGPFFRSMALADLARAAKRAGLLAEANGLLSQVVALSKANPNPRSQALGCFWAALAALEGEPPLRGDWEKDIPPILESLPRKYEQIGNMSGGGG